MKTAISENIFELVEEPVVCDAKEIRKCVAFLKTILTEEQLNVVREQYQINMHNIKTDK